MNYYIQRKTIKRSENESLRVQEISALAFPILERLSTRPYFQIGFSAPPGEHPAAVRERKYRPSEVGHVGKLKEFAGSFRAAGARRFHCVS